MNHTGSKSSKVRELIAAKPGITAREIIDTLKAQKVKIAPAQVYGLLSKASKPKRGRPANAKAIDKYESLVQAKKLADAMGGVEKARAALDVLAKLV